jgi:muramidase (phage lysozyme)
MATLEEQAAILAQVNRDLAEFGAVTETTAARLAEMNQQLTKAARAQKRYEQAMEDLGKTVGQTVLDAGKTAKQGSSMYNGALSAGAEAIDSFASKFGPWGRLIGASFQVTAKYLQAVNQQSDKLYDGFKELSRSGAIASDGMTGLFEGLQKTGMGVDQLNKYLTLLQENNKDLALYGGSVFEGRKRFEDLSKTMEPVREQFMNLGMSQEEQNASIAGYIRLQARLGRAQTTSTDELAISAKKYILEQDALTKLTGTTRQEQEQQQERAMQEEQYAAKIRQLELSGQKDAADRLREMNTLMEEAGPEMGRAFRASITGNLSSADAQKLNLSSQGKAMRDIRKVIDGTLAPAEAADNIKRAVGKTADTIGTTLGQFSAFNDSYINFGESQKARVQAENNQTAQLKKIYDDQIKTLAGLGDATTKAKASMEKAFQTITLATDAFVNLAITPVTKAMAALTRGLAGLYKLLPGGPDFFAPGETPAGTYSRSPQTAAAAQPKPAAPVVAATVVPPKSTAAPTPTGVPAATLTPAQLQTQRANRPQVKGPAARSAPPVPAAPTTVESTTAVPEKSVPSAQSPESKPQGNIQKILDYIGLKEARGRYDMLVGGKTKPDLTSMTVADVLEFQKTMRANGHETTALGKYQIIKNTLAGLVKNGTIAMNDVFNSATQDKAAIGLLREKGLDKWLGGQLSKDEFADRVARVWASMPMSSGKSSAEGVGSNKALGSRADYLAAFGARDGGMFNGPQTGYPMTLHGPEAVIPLKDGMVPVSMQDNGITDSIKQLIAQMSTTTKTPEDNASVNERLISVLGDLVRGQNQLISTSEQMLRVAAN